MTQDTPVMVEQSHQDVRCLNFPGIAKVSRPSRKRKASDRATSSTGSGRATGSTRSGKPQGSDFGLSDRKFNNRKDAIAWGRCGVLFGTGIGNIAEVIEPEFHEVAIAAYEKLLLSRI
jgi:hypothetical protein